MDMNLKSLLTKLLKITFLLKIKNNSTLRLIFLTISVSFFVNRGTRDQLQVEVMLDNIDWLLLNS